MSVVGLLLDAAVVDCQGTTYDRQGADSDDETEGFLFHDDYWLRGEKKHKSRNKSVFEGSRCLVTIELRVVNGKGRSREYSGYLYFNIEESSIEFEMERLSCVSHDMLNELCKLVITTTWLLYIHICRCSCSMYDLEFLNIINLYPISRDSIGIRPLYLQPGCSSTTRLDSISCGSICSHSPAGHKLFLGESLCKHS